MKSVARLDNHPIHPMLVTFPIALWITGFIFHLVSVGTAAAFWFKVAQWTYFVGVVGAILAAIFGFVDYFGLRLNDRQRSIATTHMLLNLVTAVLFAVTVGIMWNTPASIGWQLASLLWLPILGVVLLLVSGWLGASLVHEHGVSIAEEVIPEIEGAQPAGLKPGIAGAKGGEAPSAIPPEEKKQGPEQK